MYGKLRGDLLYVLSSFPSGLPSTSTTMFRKRRISVIPGERELRTIQLGQLKFPFELKKQIPCSFRLQNPTDSIVAFKVKTTSPKKYCVRPNAGVVMPQSSLVVTVTMQAQREAPPDMQCKDKFLVQSVTAPSGTTSKDVTQDLVTTYLEVCWEWTTWEGATVFLLYSILTKNQGRRFMMLCSESCMLLRPNLLHLLQNQLSKVRRHQRLQ